MARSAVLSRGELDNVNEALDVLEDCAGAIDLLICKSRSVNDQQRVSALKLALNDVDRAAEKVRAVFR